LLKSLAAQAARRKMRNDYFDLGGGGGLRETPFGFGKPAGTYVAHVFPASG
jgi:hypothetical protein